MPTLTDHLSHYARYHRDARNLATHAIGIPMIVLAVAMLLSRPALPVAGVVLTPAMPVALACCAFYLRLDLRLGLLMAALFAVAVAIGAQTARMPVAHGLTLSLLLFAVGWAFQFAGHVFEGRKPAFVDDLRGLLIGPLFMVVETLFLFGRAPALRAEIERRAGPMRARRLPPLPRKPT